MSQVADEVTNDDISRKRRRILIGAGFVGCVAGSLALAGPFFAPALRRHCLPYVPATENTISRIFKEMRGCQSPLIDLGSGDGRVVIAAAKHGFHQAHGIELNVWLVLYSRLKSLLSGTNSQTKFYRANLWKTDLSRYPTVVLFGGESMMEDVSTKLKEETQPGTQIISCRFPLDPTVWTPHKLIEDGNNPLWRYTQYSEHNQQDIPS